MVDILITTLEKFGFPVFRQGSLSDDDPYPDNFFTFWNNSSESARHFDNRETAIVWDFDVNFYSCNPNTTYEKLIEAKELLKKAGFIVNGNGYDVPSDEITHTGRGIGVIYVENL